MQKALRKSLLLFILFTTFKAQISVLEPEYLAKLIHSPGLPEGGLRYNISMFGDIHYSEFHNLEVILPEIGNAFGCEELFTPTLSKKTQFSFLLKRGKCPFSKKAHNAKSVGASMIFIYFDEEKAYSEFMDYFMFAPYFKENMIPAVLLQHEASQKIKSVLSTEQKVVLRVALQVENQRHEKPAVELVMVVNNLESYKLLRQIADFIRSLGSQVDFQPVYYFKQVKLNEFKTVNGLEGTTVSQHCFHGKYCLHHEAQSGRFQLAEYFEEGLRQLCLWKQADQKIQWWRYVENYRLRCLEKARYKSLRACFEATMKQVNISSLIPSIDLCTKKSQVQDAHGRVSDNASREFAG